MFTSTCPASLFSLNSSHNDLSFTPLPPKHKTYSNIIAFIWNAPPPPFTKLPTLICRHQVNDDFLRKAWPRLHDYINAIISALIARGSLLHRTYFSDDFTFICAITWGNYLSSLRTDVCGFLFLFLFSLILFTFGFPELSTTPTI